MTEHASSVVMSKIVEIIMRLLLSIVVVIGFTFIVVLGLLSVVADVLALTRHRPPSNFEQFAEEDEESEEEEWEDRNAQATPRSRRISMWPIDLI
jgi:hypothetical protein